MEFVSVRDFRTRPARIWKELASHRDLIVTSNGRPVAILSATSASTIEESLAALRRARAELAVHALQSQSARMGKSRLSPRAIQAEIRAARRQRRK